MIRCAIHHPKTKLPSSQRKPSPELSQRVIRPVALNRKNALFAGHDEGGKAWGRIASLIETAKLNGVNPFEYLKTTLERIAQGHPKDGLQELLPCNFKPLSA